MFEKEDYKSREKRNWMKIVGNNNNNVIKRFFICNVLICNKKILFKRYIEYEEYVFLDIIGK